MKKTLVVGFILSLLMLAQASHAGVGHDTRKNCKIFAKYTVTAGVGCYDNHASIGNKDKGCGYAQATASITCPHGGGATTTARNDSGGVHYLTWLHTGYGFNGPESPSARSAGPHPPSAGDASFSGTTNFDELNHQVITTITDFVMTASRERETFSVLDIALWVPTNPSSDQEPITAEKTIWAGRVLLQGGVATISGDIPPGSFSLSEDATSVTASAASVVLTMPVPPGIDLDDVLFSYRGDSGSGPIEPSPIVVADRCSAAKANCMVAKVRGLLGCHRTAELKGVPVDPSCLAKAEDKFVACVDKADAKYVCPNPGDAAALEAAIDAYVLDVVQQLDPGYPAPVLNGCSAGKKKAVAAKTAAKLRCYAKAFKKAPGTVALACLAKAEAKFAAAFTKLDSDPACLTSGDAAALETTVDAFITAAALALGPICGNGVLDPGETCDPAGGAATSCPTAANTSGWFGCTASCECPCPTSVEFAADATDPASVLDTGWTGISHRAPIMSDETVTMGAACAATSRPCGTCTLSGPVANHDADSGQLNNQRCSGDTSVKCTSAPGGAAGCGGPLGTCEWYLGSNLALAAGGVSTCVSTRFNGVATGTVNVESGEAADNAAVTTRVFSGLAIDNPCPRCVGDGASNDGTAGGSCDSGARAGLPCDGNGTVPDRPDFGTTSLDCPPSPGALIAALPLDLASATDPVTKTLSASSPSCSGEPGEHCLCDTCNNGNAEPCGANGDCPDPAGPIGPLCGGKRCIGGPSAGAACTSGSECPSGICSRPGEPTKPSGCLDDTTTAGVFDCTDSAPLDDEGECSQGPIEQQCTLASGHAQRGCNLDADCGGGAGSCAAANRKCFLTGGFTGKVGSNTLIAAGMEDTPVNDESNPTLGAVFCVGPTASAAVNSVAGLPGPSRLTLRGTGSGRP